MGCGPSTVQKDVVAERKTRKSRRQEALIRLAEEMKGGNVVEDERVVGKLEVMAELPEAVVTWKGDGSIVFVNDGLLDLFRHSENSLRHGNLIEKILDCQTTDYDTLCYKYTDCDGFRSTGSTFPTTLFTFPLATSHKTTIYAGLVSEADASLRSKTSPTASPPPLSPGNVAAVDRRLQFADLLIALDSDHTVVSLSEDMGSLLPGVSVGCHITVLLHPEEKKDILEVLDSDHLGFLTTEMRKFRFGNSLDDNLYLAVTGVTVIGGIRVISFHAPPKRRGVVFMRHQFPDDIASILDVLQVPIMVVSRGGVIEYWNPSAERTFGARSQAVVGKNVDITIPYPFNDNHHVMRRTDATRAVLHTTSRPVIARHLRTGDLICLYLSIREAALSHETVYYICSCEMPDPLEYKTNTSFKRFLERADGTHPNHPLPDLSSTGSKPNIQ